VIVIVIVIYDYKEKYVTIKKLDILHGGLFMKRSVFYFCLSVLMILMIIIITIQQNRIYQLQQAYLNEVNEDVVYLDEDVDSEIKAERSVNLHDSNSTDIVSSTRTNENIVLTSQDMDIPSVVQIPRRFMPMNIHTRGQFEYTQVGVISEVDQQHTDTSHSQSPSQSQSTASTHTVKVVSEDGQQTTYESVISHMLPSSSSRIQILALYGRPTYPGSNKWNFYTSTDGYHLLRIPIFYKNKNCTAEYGCDELYDGDFVRVEEYGKTFRVRLYESEQLRYIPIY
jgi:hypothetical protein